MANEMEVPEKTTLNDCKNAGCGEAINPSSTPHSGQDLSSAFSLKSDNEVRTGKANISRCHS
jgi:hypothetical protein